MKLPCRLTHNSITGSSQNEGETRWARAAMRPPHQITRHGHASRCGRASMDGAALRQRDDERQNGIDPGQEAPKEMQQDGSGQAGGCRGKDHDALHPAGSPGERQQRL